MTTTDPIMDDAISDASWDAAAAIFDEIGFGNADRLDPRVRAIISRRLRPALEARERAVVEACRRLMSAIADVSDERRGTIFDDDPVCVAARTALAAYEEGGGS